MPSNAPKIPGAFRARVPAAAHRLRQIEAEGRASAQVVDLLIDLARGTQPERPFTVPSVPRWAAVAMGAR